MFDWFDNAPRRIFAAIAVTCVGLLAFGVYLQQVVGLEPKDVPRVQLFLIFRRHEWRVNQTQAERGSRARHSVRGVLSPTDANARARVALDALEVFA